MGYEPGARAGGRLRYGYEGWQRLAWGEGKTCFRFAGSMAPAYTEISLLSEPTLTLTRPLHKKSMDETFGTTMSVVD